MNGPMPGPHMTGPMWMPTLPVSPSRLLAWHPQPVPLLVILTAGVAVLYGMGVARLARNGDRWPVGRSIGFGAGILTLLAMSGTGVNGYGMALFSVHMVQHMVLAMITPVLLLLGRPVTLSLRGLPSHGWARRALLVVLHSRLARTLTTPLVTVPLFLSSLYGLYFTPVFDVLMNNWLGHDLMLTHFVVVGLLLFWPILGLDPSPHPHPHPVRLLEVFLPMPFHAFFGISLMSTSTLIVSTFAHPPTSWHLSPLSDQHLGGALAWGFGEAPALFVSLLVALSWAQASDREARRHDRAEDRTHDGQLNAYNTWLATLNQQAESGR